MWIDAARRRIFNFIVTNSAPVKHSIMRVWYEYEPGPAMSIRAGLNPHNNENVYEFRVEQDTIVWTIRGEEPLWRHVTHEEYPQWLESRVADANSKMDELESNA